MSTRRLPVQVLEQIQGARNRLVRAKVLVGFDGFVDTILHVVKTRESTTKYTRIEKMKEFGDRISAAAGLSTNMEMVTQMVKLGGTGNEFHKRKRMASGRHVCAPRVDPVVSTRMATGARRP